MNKLVVAGAIIGTVVFAGCVSIEEQLASKDPQVRAEGLRRASDAAIADLWSSQSERIARLNQLDSDEALCDVIVGISSQRQTDYLKGVYGSPFNSYIDERGDYSRVNANVAVIKAAADKLKNPTSKQVYAVLAVAKNTWPRGKDEKIVSVNELPQVLDSLAMKFEGKDSIYQLLKDSKDDSSAKIWLPSATRSKLYLRYIAKEDDQNVLKQIAREGYTQEAYISQYGDDHYASKGGDNPQVLNKKAAIKRISDGNTLLELTSRASEDMRKMAFDRILELKDQKALAQLFVENDAYGFFDDKDRISKSGGFQKDVTKEKATELISHFTEQTAIASLATSAKSFYIRSLAIDKVEDQKILKEIATGIKDCPHDIEQKEKGMFDNTFDWMDMVKNAGAAKLQGQAIKKLTDPNSLKDLRKNVKSDSIKKLVSARMVELGINSLDDIIAATGYTKNLFVMLAEVTDKKDLQKIIDKAKLPGVKILAASKIDQKSAVSEASKQTAAIKGKATAGKFVLGDFYLGMPVEDAFAILWAKYPEVKPAMYIDGDKDEFLNISLCAEFPCDFSWTEVANMTVYRITLSPDMVRKMIGFKGGSFSDMESAVEKYMGVSFGSDMLERRYRWSVWGSEKLNRRLVSQKIGTVASVSGETLRFFSGERDKEPINIMQFAERCEWNLSDAEKQEKRIRESQNDANYTLAYQGSIRLEFTKNAAKGLWGANGSFTKSIGDALKNKLKSAAGNKIKSLVDGAEELQKASDDLKNAPDALGKTLDGTKSEMQNAVKEALGDKDLQKSMDDLKSAADALNNLSL